MISPPRERKRVFVIGVGRSGTSLLQAMLHAHPRICFAPETGFLRQYASRKLLTGLYRSRGSTAVIERICSDPRIGRLELSQEAMAAIVDSLGDSLTDQRVYEELLDAHAECRKPSATLLGDKDPRLTEYLPLIADHWPDATVLHIIRDPRDIIASKKKAEWSQHWPFLFHLLTSRVQLELGRTGRRHFGSRYRELSYEVLISSPVEALTDACGTLGIEFDPAMLQFAASSSELVAPDELQWKSETLGPLLPRNRDKWKTTLSPFEVAATERICAEGLRFSRAEPSASTSPLPLPQRLALAVVGLGAPLVSALYRGYRACHTRR